MPVAIMIFFLMLAPTPADAQNERVDYVVSELDKSGFPRTTAEALFADDRVKMYPPREVAPRTIDWDKIIASLVATQSVQRGAKFHSKYQEILNKVQKDFGVDKTAIVGLLRLESDFGRNTGDYVVFNVFYTSMMRAEEEKRWKWFAENLISLAQYCKKGNYDCLAVRGSYGGALGPAQFLPKSAELFGADGDGNGVIDLTHPLDAIYSAANFLVEHGWHEDHMAALGRYYGSANGYPRAVMAYAEALRKSLSMTPLPPATELNNKDSNSRVIGRAN